MDLKTLEALLDSKFEGQKLLFEEKFKVNSACHDELKEQAKYTNGRVRRLEKVSYALGGAVFILGWQVANIKNIKEFFALIVNKLT